MNTTTAKYRVNRHKHSIQTKDTLGYARKLFLHRQALVETRAWFLRNLKDQKLDKTNYKKQKDIFNSLYTDRLTLLDNAIEKHYNAREVLNIHRRSTKGVTLTDGGNQAEQDQNPAPTITKNFKFTNLYFSKSPTFQDKFVEKLTAKGVGENVTPSETPLLAAIRRSVKTSQVKIEQTSSSADREREGSRVSFASANARKIIGKDTPLDHAIVNAAIKEILHVNPQLKKDVKDFARGQNSKQVLRKIRGLTALIILEEKLKAEGETLDRNEKNILSKLRSTIARPEISLSQKGVVNIIEFADELAKSKLQKDDSVVSARLVAARSKLVSSFILNKYNKKLRTARNILLVIAISLLALSIISGVGVGISIAAKAIAIGGFALIPLLKKIAVELSAIGLITLAPKAWSSIRNFLGIKSAESKFIDDTLTSIIDGNILMKILKYIASPFVELHKRRTKISSDKQILRDKIISLEVAIDEPDHAPPVPAGAPAPDADAGSVGEGATPSPVVPAAADPAPETRAASSGLGAARQSAALA